MRQQHFRCQTNFSDLSPNRKQAHPIDQISTTLRKTPTYSRSPILLSSKKVDLEIQRLVNVIQLKEDENELMKRKINSFENEEQNALKEKYRDLNDREEYIRELQFQIREMSVENSSIEDFYKKQLQIQQQELENLRQKVKNLQAEQQQNLLSRIDDEIEQLKQCLEIKVVQNQELYQQGQSLMEETNILKQQQNELLDQIDYLKNMNKQIQEQCQMEIKANNRNSQKNGNDFLKLKEENLSLQKQIEVFELKIQQLKEDLTIQNHEKMSQIKEYQEEVGLAKNEIKKYKAYIQEKNLSNESQTRLISQLNQMLEKLQNQNLILQERLHDCQESLFREKEKKEGSSFNWQNMLQSKNTEIDELHLERQALHIEINELNIIQQKLLAESESLRAKLLERDRQIFIDEQIKVGIVKSQEDLGRSTFYQQLQKMETENFNLRVLLETKSRECEEWKANYLKKALKFS